MDNPISFTNIVESISALATICTFIYLIIVQRKRDNTQQFEASLFNLLSLHNEIISSMRYKDHEGSYEGRAVFHIAKLLSNAMVEKTHNKVEGNSIVSYNISNIEEVRECLSNDYYADYYSEFESNLNHYFRNLYHIFLYIDSSGLIPFWNPFAKNKRKYNYARLVRAQLSQDELFAIMLNCMIQSYGYPEFMKLIKKYKILKNFRDKDVKCRPLYDLYCELHREVKPNTVDGGVVAKNL